MGETNGTLGEELEGQLDAILSIKHPQRLDLIVALDTA